MSTSIPVILCGKIPTHQVAVPQALIPEYEVLQAFANVESFSEAFPAHFESSTRKPAAILMGAGFDRNEFNTAYAVPGASSIPWLRPFRTKRRNEHLLLQESQAPIAEMVASKARKMLDEHVETLKAREGGGEIWYF